MSSVAMRKKKLRRAAIRMTDAGTQNGRDRKGPEQDRRTLSQKMRTERASPAPVPAPQCQTWHRQGLPARWGLELPTWCWRTAWLWLRPRSAQGGSRGDVGPGSQPWCCHVHWGAGG